MLFIYSVLPFFGLFVNEGLRNVDMKPYCWDKYCCMSESNQAQEIKLQPENKSWNILKIVAQIFSYLFSIITILIGISLLNGDAFVSGILYIISGLVILPLLTKKFIKPKIGSKVFFLSPLFFVIISFIATIAFAYSPSQIARSAELKAQNIVNEAEKKKTDELALVAKQETDKKIQITKEINDKKIIEDKKIADELLAVSEKEKLQKTEESKKNKEELERETAQEIKDKQDIEQKKKDDLKSERQDFNSARSNTRFGAEISGLIYDGLSSKGLVNSYLKIETDDKKTLMDFNNGLISQKQLNDTRPTATLEITMSYEFTSNVSNSSIKDLLTEFHKTLTIKLFEIDPDLKMYKYVYLKNPTRTIAKTSNDFWNGGIKVEFE